MNKEEMNKWLLTTIVKDPKLSNYVLHNDWLLIFMSLKKALWDLNQADSFQFLLYMHNFLKYLFDNADISKDDIGLIDLTDESLYKILKKDNDGDFQALVISSENSPPFFKLPSSTDLFVWIPDHIAHKLHGREYNLQGPLNADNCIFKYLFPVATMFGRGYLIF